MKTLVIWYSRTGTTRAVADELVRLTDGDRDEIVERRHRRGLRGYLRSGYEARQGRPAPIMPATKDPAAYDLVVIGSPIWAGRLSSPVATYLRAHAGQLGRVGFFVTYGGSGAPAVLAQMATLAGRTPIARLALRAADVADGAHRLAVRGFVEELRDQLRVVAMPRPPEVVARPH